MDAMVTQSAVEIARAWVGMFGAGDLDGLRSLYAADATLAAPGDEQPTEGIEAIGDTIQEWMQAFPDLRGTVNHLHADGNTVTLEATFEGTWSGPLRMSDGRTPTPTMRPMTITVCEVMEIESGRIQAVRGYYDTLTMLQQIGAM
jgi:steroid delta-isomerase-like uncharacterized protein